MVKLKLDSKTNQWVELPKGSKEEGSMYLDGYLYNSLKDAKKIMEEGDLYLPIICCGYPGTGKSTICMQGASFFQPDFNETGIFCDSEKFIEAVKIAKPLDALILDESWESLSTYQIRSKLGSMLKNLLNVVRKKRLYIFIILPDYFDLSKSIAIFLSRWLILCYEKTFGDIGYFCAFDRSSKKKLYVYGKKFNDYDCVRADFYGTFTKYIPENINWKAYQKMKDAYTDSINVEDEGQSVRAIKQRDKLILFLNKKGKGVSAKDIAKECGVMVDIVYRVIRDSKKVKKK